MKVFIDTRQKKEKHENIDNWFLKNNITVEYLPLNVGDYMLDPNGGVSVDTKQDIYELASNLFGKKETIRFQKECKRAKEKNIKLYILIEQQMTKQRLLSWKSKKTVTGKLITKITGKQIYHNMQIYSLAFGVKWRFCKKSETGAKILKLLGREK